MDAKKHRVGKIFDGSIRLVVPLFQRPYVWNDDRSFQPLRPVAVAFLEPTAVEAREPQDYSLNGRLKIQRIRRLKPLLAM